MNTKNNRPSRETGASRRRPLAMALLALALATTRAAAAPGDLDPSFGDHGRVRVGHAGSSDRSPGRIPVARQADGRILVAGRNPDGSVGVTRLKPDGTTDAAFGTSGTARVDFGLNGPATIRAIDIAADGGIMIAGHVVIDSRSGARDIAVARLTPNGSLDGSFGSGGRVTLDLRAGADDTANAMVIQPDGRIALAGSSAGGGDGTSVALVRLMPDGTADASFGSAGRTLLRTVTGGATAYGLAMQPDGKLVGCGGANNFAAVFRVLANGTPDPGFGSSPGWSYVAEGAAYDCAVRPDGRLVLAGSDGSQATVMQLTADGKLDKTFSGNGVASVTFSCDARCSTAIGDTSFGAVQDYATDVVALADGGLVVAGVNSASDLTLARLDANGNTVSIFGRGGSQLVDLGHDTLVPTLVGASVLSQSDGRLIAAGAGNVESTLVRILMDDSPGTSVVGLTDTGLSWVENYSGPSSRVKIRRTGSSRGAVSVDYDLVNGTATSPGDYAAGNGTVTWTDGDDSDKYIQISLVRDSIREEPEEFRLVLLNSSGAGLAAREATVTLTDEAPGAIGFQDRPWEVMESTGSITLWVERTGSSGGAVSISYRTVEIDKGAKANDDYTPTHGTLEWSDAESGRKSIVIPITQDSRAESLESFEVRLESATGGAAVVTGHSTATVTIYEAAPVAPSPKAPGGGSGGGGSTGLALLSLAALLLTCARRRHVRHAIAVHH